MTAGQTNTDSSRSKYLHDVTTTNESEPLGPATASESNRISIDSGLLTEATATPGLVSSRSSATLLPDAHPRNHRQLSISPSPHPGNRRALGLGSESPAKPASDQDVTWSSLPRKGQLLILTLARLSEPLTQTSLQSYLYYQLQSFDRALTPAQITAQAGIVTATFAAAQAVTSVLWGRVADARWGGRKLVILVGLVGTAVGTLGFGFSKNWGVLVAFRVLAGALNGNVGVMRTMISEIVKDRKYLSRAFLLMPMCFNIGVILGPIMGGLLADPVDSYPNLFGPGSLFGGKDGVSWMMAFPYALPNILSATYLLSSALLVFLGLEETLDTLRDRPDFGLRIGKTLQRAALRTWKCHWHKRDGYSALPDDASGAAPVAEDLESHTPATPATPLTPFAPKTNGHAPKKRKLPFRRMWTRNVSTTLLSYSLMAMSVGTFNALWFMFLSAPRSTSERTLPFEFTGGLSLPPAKIGLAMAILGVIGISMQLLLYPRISGRWGTLRSYQVSMLIFPVVYLLVPYLSIVPSTGPATGAAQGPWVWTALACLLALQVLARTFAIPAGGILVNNGTPHPSVLGTMHGVAQSMSAAARTLGPVGAGWLFGVGYGGGVVGLAFWTMAAVSAVGSFVSWFAWEGDGHEIWLEGERDDSLQNE